MIQRIYDEQYYPFAPALKDQLNHNLSYLLKEITAFIKERQGHQPNLTAFIRHENYYKQNATTVNFSISVDNQSLLHIQGEFDRQTNTIICVSLKAILPSEQLWTKDMLEYLELREADGVLLKNKHSRFANLMTSFRLSSEKVENTTPDNEWGYPRTTVFISMRSDASLAFFNSSDGVHFVESYYRYIQSVHSFFERKLR